MTYRESFRPHIAAVIAAHRYEGEKAIRRALRARYEELGLMPRRRWVYRAWCQEVRAQLAPRATLRGEPVAEAAGQGNLFEAGGKR